MERFNAGVLKNYVDSDQIAQAKAYMNKFFYKSGCNIFYFNGKSFDLYSQADALSLVPNDIYRYNGKNVVFKAKDYLKSAEFMSNEYTPTINHKKPRTFEAKGEKYINMAKPKTITEIVPVKKSVKKDLQCLYDHIMNVWCSKNVELYEWVLNFIACTLNGRKLRKAIYSQCTERCGRGTVINFLKRILGKAMVKTNSVEVVSKYTKPFEGTLLVNLDEMPVDSGNFKSIADACKSLITEPTFTCRDMYHTGYEQKNTFNIIITTNNDAIHLTQSNNQRYVVLDVDESMKDNTQYFTKLNKILKRDDIKQAFYTEMNERYQTLEDWNEDVMPKSKERKRKIIEALPRLYKWLKEKYVLTSKDLDMRTKHFFETYKAEEKDNTTKEKLARMLTDIGVKRVHVFKSNTNQYDVYRMTHEEMKAVFEERGWLDEEYDIIENVDDEDMDDLMLDQKCASVIQTYEQRIKQLERIIKEKDALLKEKKEVVEVIPKKKSKQEKEFDAEVKRAKQAKKQAKKATGSDDIDDLFDLL